MSGASSPTTLVSVVLIFHNEERFLAEAIGSIHRQSHPHWELLLVDDGSTDRSRDIASAAVDRAPDRVRLLEHPNRENRGMSASRNLGIAEARGAYLAFLDGDDVYLPQRLRRHVEVLDRHPDVGLVLSDHIRWRSWQGGAIGSRFDVARPFASVGDEVLPAPQGLLRILRAPALVAGTCDLTIRTELARAVGGFVDGFTSLFEDQAFFAKVLHGARAYLLRDYLALYRYHPASATRALAEAGGGGGLEVDRFARAYWDWLIEWLRAAGEPPDSELLVLAREGRARVRTRAARGLRRRLGGIAKRLLRRSLPERVHAELVRLDHLRNARSAKKGQRGLADAGSRDALAAALREIPPATTEAPGREPDPD